MEFATNAKGNAALTTGIIGTAGVGLSLLNGLGGLGGLFGGMPRTACSGDVPVNRYEAAQAARIAELETEVKLRDANTFTMGEMNKLRDYVDGKFARVEHELGDQRVYNATMNSAVGCIQGQIAQLYSLTKLVVPNGSICPGWGDVTVSVTPAAAG